MLLLCSQSRASPSLEESEPRKDATLFHPFTSKHSTINCGVNQREKERKKESPELGGGDTATHHNATDERCRSVESIPVQQTQSRTEQHKFSLSSSRHEDDIAVIEVKFSFSSPSSSSSASLESFLRVGWVLWDRIFLARKGKIVPREINFLT